MSDSPIHPISGIRIGVAQAGFKRAGRDDLVLFELADGTATSAVFTRNAFAAAPVQIARANLRSGPPRYLLINSGNANAGTGAGGGAAASATCAEAARLGRCAPAAVLPFSTGVIGEPLPTDKFTAALPAAFADLDALGWQRAARAIMTTDTRPKLASSRHDIGGRAVHLTGIAKGAGMIAPNMATMLAYVATDAAVAPALLDAMLIDAVEQSFNCVTVDGDTSTNDACVLMATGASGAPRIDTPIGDDARVFRAALTELCVELAQAIARDGEGATKFVTISVGGGRDRAECRHVGLTVANSPLVKTALFAADPNWGRILAAVGRTGLSEFAIERVGVDIGGFPIVREGARVPDYVEAPVAAVLQRPEYCIRIDLGRGEAEARVWTCDFSYDYVRINAEYRS